MDYYHIHRKGDHDELYHERSTIHFGDESNKMWKCLLHRSASYLDRVETDENNQKRYVYLPLNKVDSYEEFMAMEPEQQKNYFNYLNMYVRGSAIDFRELVLEDVRERINPDLPSRMNCVWLTNKKNLDKWMKLLHTSEVEYEVYKVDPDGKMFSSVDELLPDLSVPREMQVVQARRYWNPTREDITNGTREILFEGDLRLLKRVK